MKFIPETRRVD